jgi:hypothetical protein
MTKVRSSPKAPIAGPPAATAACVSEAVPLNPATIDSQPVVIHDAAGNLSTIEHAATKLSALVDE